MTSVLVTAAGIGLAITRHLSERGWDVRHSQLSPAHRELYASHLAGNRKLRSWMHQLAGDPQKVVKAVDRALPYRRPNGRYRCDNVSRAQRALVSATPTAVTDALFAGATTS